MDNEKLFSEFPAISTKEWEEAINKDLKGADYTKRLVWRTDEGFSVRPYYRKEDLEQLDFPYIRENKKNDNSWEIVQKIEEENIGAANKIACDSLKKGATMVALSVAKITNYDDLKTLLNGIELEKFGVQFYNIKDSLTLIRLFIKYIEDQKYEKEKIHGSLLNDCATKTREEKLKTSVELIRLTDDLPHFKIIDIYGIGFHDAGATITQEIAFSLGYAEEYLNYATDNGLTIEQIARKIQFSLSIGNQYFMEIAKLRASRLLWAMMLSAYKPKCKCAYRLIINSVASTWNKTLYDPYVNLLRSTTEGMSAALGGADSITLQPFDIAYKESNEFSSRLSRNTQIILKEEAFFDKVIDPGAGSYYIENLTNSIAESSWKLFQEIESQGGMFAYADAGKSEKVLEESRQKRDCDIATRKRILLGTNQYPNVNETMAEQSEKLGCPLTATRGAKAFEAIRLATEKHAKTHGRPKVFLLKTGNLAMRQARAGFATNFFGCAGYEILDQSGFEDINAGVAEAATSKADVIVLCSSDEEYATIGIDAVRAAKSQTKAIVIVAGNPECANELKEAGVDDFIHVRSNLLDTLTKYNSILLR